MLTITGLNCSGMFSFGQMPTVSLECVGTVFIQGVNEDHDDGSNGSGKSSILNSIKEILFGRNDTGKSGPNIVNRHKAWKNGMFGAIWFRDSKNVSWRVFDVRKWKGEPPIQTDISEVTTNDEKYEGSDVFLERFDGNKWIDERATSMGNKSSKDTRIKIINIVGMTYEQFSSYVCLGQRAESSLISGTSGEREKIIQAVSDVSVWDKATGIIKNMCVCKENELNNMTHEITGMTSAVAMTTVPTDADITNVEVEKVSILRNINELVARANILNASIEATKKERAAEAVTIEGVKLEIEILDAELRHTYERMQQHKRPSIPQHINALQTDISVKQVELNNKIQLVNKYAKLGVGQCGACGQVITKEHLDKEINNLQQEINERTAYINKQKTCYDIELTNHEAEVQAQEVAFKAKCDHELNGTLASKSVLQQQIDKAYFEIDNKIGQLQTQLQDAVYNINSSKIRLEAFDSQILSMQNKIIEINNIKNKLSERMAQKDRLSVDIQHYRWVERHLKKVKLVEYDSVIDRLNALVNTEINALWGPGMTIQFATAQEKVSGGIKQELSLMVHTNNTEGVPIEMYSGGETKSIVIAVFKAMMKLAKERGQGVNLAAIDEIDKDLDDSNADRLVDAFEAIAADVQSCIVISHNFRLLNTMKFDQVWTVIKKNGFSTINFGEANV